MLKQLEFNDPSLVAVKETDIYRLRRGLCLPSAAATCINTVLGERVIGEKPGEGKMTLGEFYRILLPHHNEKGLVNSEGQQYPNPWFVVTEQGDMYHQAVIAIAKGCSVNGISIANFDSLDPITAFMENGGKVALSLDNRFVIDKTLHKRPDLTRNYNGKWQILTETKDGIRYQNFEEGRHVVSLIDIDQEGNILLHDSFCLPQMERELTMMTLPSSEIEPYLVYAQGGATRAVAFSKGQDAFVPLTKFKRDVFIPSVVVNEVKELLA